jgi:LEA14-like dessication related protein
VPVSFTFEGLYRSFASIIGDREAAYTIALDISFPIPLVGDKVFSFDFSGVLPLPQLPELSFNRMNVSRVDFFGTDLSLEINVKNPNNFPIAFPQLDWNYTINGVPVVASNFAGAGQGSIAAGAAGSANIGITLMYADILRTAGSAMNVAGEVAGDFFVGMNLADIGLPSAVLEAAAAQSILNIPASIPVLRKPEVSFGGITRRSLGFMRMEFALTLEVANANSFAFDINEFNYEIRVNNHLWIQSNIEEPLRVAANSSVVIPLNVVITTPAMVEELVTILSRGSTVNYALTGNMSLVPERQGLEKLELPLNIRGSSRIL